MSNSHTICLVDDHDIVRKGLRNVFSLEYGFKIIGEASSCKEARTLLDSIEPDVLIMDQMLGDGSGIDLSRELKPQVPNTKIILLTAFPVTDEDSEFTILYKDQSSVEIRKAVLEALGHESLSDVKLLSHREQEILQFIARGWQNKEISSEIGISEKTVRNTISNIFKKLNVHNRTEAARLILE